MGKITFKELPRYCRSLSSFWGCGFSCVKCDCKSLCRRFEKKYGMLPNQYVLDAVNNNAYYLTCNCPHCANTLMRSEEEAIAYCTFCGAKIHMPPFTQEEIDEARFERRMDDYDC